MITFRSDLNAMAKVLADCLEFGMEGRKIFLLRHPSSSHRVYFGKTTCCYKHGIGFVGSNLGCANNPYLKPVYSHQLVESAKGRVISPSGRVDDYTRVESMAIL
jgi:hypothetical protein